MAFLAHFPSGSMASRLFFMLLSYLQVAQAQFPEPGCKSSGDGSFCRSTSAETAMRLSSLLQTQAKQAVRMSMPAVPEFFEEDAVGPLPPAMQDAAGPSSPTSISGSEAAPDAGSGSLLQTSNSGSEAASDASSGVAQQPQRQADQQIVVEPPLPPAAGARDGAPDTGGATTATSFAVLSSSGSGPTASSGGGDAPEALSLLGARASGSMEPSDEFADEPTSGHSMVGERVREPGAPPDIAGDTGEEGELVGKQNRLQRLMFPNKDEAMLADDRRLLKHQHELDQKQEDTREAFAHLKARTYESADMSRWRLMEGQRLQSDLQRMELLADANKYKADLAVDSTQEVEHLAELERGNHLARQSSEAEQNISHRVLGEEKDGTSKKPKKSTPSKDMDRAVAAATDELQRIEAERGRQIDEIPRYLPCNSADCSSVDELAPQYDGHCTPTCSWSCQSPKCDEICTPVCQPPRCETRCLSMSTEGCSMECTKPHCAVMCPKSLCPAPMANCPSCTTQCSEPQCKMKCPKSRLCHNYCEQPRCEWRCKAPLHCPKPKCQMICETPRKCGSASFSEQLPPLLPGQSGVETFAAPSWTSTDDTIKATSLSSGSDGLQRAVEVPSTSSVDVRVRSMAPVQMLPAGEPQTSMASLPVMQDPQSAVDSGSRWIPTEAGQPVQNA